MTDWALFWMGFWGAALGTLIAKGIGAAWMWHWRRRHPPTEEEGDY